MVAPGSDSELWRDGGRGGRVGQYMIDEPTRWKRCLPWCNGFMEQQLLASWLVNGDGDGGNEVWGTQGIRNCQMNHDEWEFCHPKVVHGSLYFQYNINGELDFPI